MRKEYRNGTLELRGFAELFENGAAVFLTFVYICLKMFGIRVNGSLSCLASD